MQPDTTFETYMRHVGRTIAAHACGMTHDDFADANWYLLYEESDFGQTGNFSEDDADAAIDLLAEADDIFAGMAAL